MKRPIVLVDLDNVVYDFIKAMAMWLDKNKALPFGGSGGVSTAMQRYKQWSVWEDWNMSKGEFIRWWRLGIEAEEIYAKGPLIAGARDALWRLSDAEWDIHIATSRLTKFGLHDQIVANTAQWLRSNNIPYRNIHFTDDKTTISADAIIDDRADNMDSTVHGKTFLFPANHNVTPYESLKGNRETLTSYVGPVWQTMEWETIVESLC